MVTDYIHALLIFSPIVCYFNHKSGGLGGSSLEMWRIDGTAKNKFKIKHLR